MAVMFDCSSDMALFRKPYTTTSSVSFAFPPPSAIAGLVSAIVGLDNGASGNASHADYWKELAGTRVAVALLRQTRWLRAAVNFWNVKNPQTTPHIQVKHQFVASPRYRVYVSGGIEDRLKHYLEEGRFVYTPYLGVAYALAQIDYIGACDPQPMGEGEVRVDTVVPWAGEGMELNLAESGGIFSERVPFRLTTERALAESVKVVYSADVNRPLCVRKRGELHVTRCAARGVEDIVAWFPEC